MRLTMDQQPFLAKKPNERNWERTEGVRKDPRTNKKHQYLKETKEMEKEKTNPIKKSKKDASSDKEPATLPGGENKGRSF